MQGICAGFAVQVIVAIGIQHVCACAAIEQIGVDVASGAHVASVQGVVAAIAIQRIGATQALRAANKTP